MMSNILYITRDASAAPGRGDTSTLRDEFLAENVVWHVAGTGPPARAHQGVEEVRAVLARVSELTSGSIRPELHDVLASTDHSLALATIHAQRAGKQIQLNLVHVIHGDNGKATEVRTPTSDPAGAAAFWS